MSAPRAGRGAGCDAGVEAVGCGPGTVGVGQAEGAEGVTDVGALLVRRSLAGGASRPGIIVATDGKGRAPMGNVFQRIRIVAIQLAYEAARFGVAEW